MTLIAATNNPGKLVELKRMLEPEGFKILSMRQANVYAEIEETAPTYEGNAEIKAVIVSEVTDMPVIADDSGLEVDALDGAPGVFSARYAGNGASSTECIGKLLECLRDVPPEKRGAHFVCSVCCILPGGKMIRTCGRCDGWIAKAVSNGGGGFGYDPVFIESNSGIAFSDLSQEEKDKVSHRGMAVRELVKKLRETDQSN
ncbi:MAG: RdgB/HAM1 family non-canonical purine NTP pyrophosphatase [Clostridia bacterium]|nr:RdgB/HAM1 family non-canonical purine NTP pyrophosphatase [Clostridia bacterium]